MQLVTSTCNQCDQNSCSRCPAESLARSEFVNNAGDHCLCAAQGHKTTETTKEIPRIKSMLGSQKEERDAPVGREIIEEKEADSFEDNDD